MKLILEHILKKFDTKIVLKDASFTFEKGKIYGLLGRNGAGKTTLFNCINEDLPKDGGIVQIMEDSGLLRSITSDDIGYVLSVPVVPEFLTGREFIKFFIEINEKKIKNLKSPDEYFELMKIAPEDRDKLMKDYSHGMKNKMQMTSFDVVVADEMKKLLKAVKNDHILIFSTHILELALDLCDEIVLLSGGCLDKREKGSLDEDVQKEKIIDTLRGEDE